MGAQPFETIASGDPSLLAEVEAVVLEAHRDWYRSEGRKWSRPIAYHWLRYEDPLPVKRLGEAVEKLLEAGVRIESAAVEKACTEAARRGFSN
jgi:hypothetical protein